MCPAGKGDPTNTGTCTECGDGFYSPVNENLCFACPENADTQGITDSTDSSACSMLINIHHVTSILKTRTIYTARNSAQTLNYVDHPIPSCYVVFN